MFRRRAFFTLFLLIFSITIFSPIEKVFSFINSPDSAFTETKLGSVNQHINTSETISATLGWTGEINQENAHFGSKVSDAGDVNGDGYGDVIVAANRYTNGQTEEGGVFLYYGSDRGLADNPDWSVESDQENSFFGYAIGTAGDVNGDGYDDIIIGAYYYSNGENLEGRVFVYHGSSSGLSTSPDWTAEGDQVEAIFGGSVATAGDVNGDGYDDVIIGSTLYDNDQTDEGRVFVYHGSDSGLSTAPDWTVESNQTMSEFGDSVASAGDVNGDGYGDVVIGARAYDNGQTNEGGVWVYLGSDIGLLGTYNCLIESNSSWGRWGDAVGSAGDVNGDGFDDVIVGAASNHASVYYGSSTGISNTAGFSQDNVDDGYGNAVGAAGDVNADGYDDIIIGARNSNRAYIYHGSSSGVSDVDWTVEIEQEEANFGGTVSTAGDVNNDGYDEIVIGALLYDNGETDEGGAFLYYYLNNTPPIADAGFDQSVYTLSLVTLDGSSSSDPDDDTSLSYQWTQTDGTSVTLIGDTTENPTFTAPDDPDVITISLVVTDSLGLASEADEVNITVNNQAPVADAGLDQSVKTLSTVLLDGSSSYDPDWDGYDDLIIGAKYFSNGQDDEGRAFVFMGSNEDLLLGWTSESNQEEASYGESVAYAGDVNGDGFDDVIVGAYLFDNEYENAGKASLFYGSALGLSTTANWTVEGTVTNAGLGETVSPAGDVNGDRYDDVIVYINGGAGTGSVTVYYGSSSGLSTTPSWTQNSPQAGAQFGASSSTAGDVNGDGYDDVIIGAFAYDNGQTNEGRAFIFHGSSSGLSTTPDWVTENNLSNSWYGASVASAGDVNGDGFDDVIVGAPYETSWTWSTEKGRAYIYHGSSSGLSTSPTLTITSDQANAWLGYSVSSAGDVNGDGYSDVIIGAFGYDNGQSNEGQVHVYFGSASGLSATPEWTKEGDQAGARFGFSVAVAGDLNSDGFNDVVIGSPTYDHGQIDEGCAFVYYGSSTGLSETPNWSGEGEQEGAQFGWLVSSVGNVNGYIPLLYQWNQTGGTTITLDDETTMNPSFTAPSNADTLLFSLIVTDGLGLTSMADTVTIEVESYKFFLPLINR